MGDTIMKEFKTVAELEASKQTVSGLMLYCRENNLYYIVQDAGYTPTGDDVTFTNGRVGKAVFIADAKYIRTTSGNVQDDLDGIVAGGLPTQSGNEFKFLSTDGSSAQWTKGQVEVATFAELEALDPEDDGLVFICQERGNARYILREIAYISKIGDVTFDNGRVGQLQDRTKFSAFEDIYDAVSDSGAKVTGIIAQEETTTVAMNGDEIFESSYSLNVANGTTTLGFTPFANGAKFLNSQFDGGTVESGGTRNRTAHMINMSGTAVDGVDIKGCEITGWTFPILKSNTSGGTQGRFSVVNNYFHGNYGVDALFNSPAAGSLMNNIVVSGNMFGDNLAEDIGGFSHRASMAGHVENFAFIGNIAYGQGNEIWRAEEAARNGIVSGNAAQLGDRHGIEVTDNNVGGIAYTPSQIVLSGNAFEGKSLAGTRGLHFTFDGSGVHPIEKSICGGNIVSKWETGVRLARKANLNDNSGNVINDCAIGILAQEPTLTTDNTMMVDVTTKFDADEGGLFGSVNLRDTSSETPLFTNIVDAAGNPAAVTGWTYESGRFATDNAANTYIPIIEIGAGFNLDIVIYFGREAGNYSFVRGTLNWDGTTLTFTESHRTQAGSLVLSGGAPFRENAGNLEVNIFAGSPAVYSNCRLQIKATGVHVFS